MDQNAYYPSCGTLRKLRTEEEAKYDLNEQILELYDTGMPVTDIAEKLRTSMEYVESVLNGVQLEAR